MSTAVQVGLNMLQVGALRIPTLIAQTVGIAAVGEIACRAIGTLLNQVGFTGESDVVKAVSTYIPDIRPYKKLSNKDLAAKAITCLAIGIIGSELVSFAFGPAPAIYNKMLGYMGNFRISNDSHPLIQVLSAYATRFRA
jgi:hypothetical protein